MMTQPNTPTPLSRRAALSDRRAQLARMIEIREVEAAIQALFSEGHVRGSTHLANGQEAVAVGIARALDPDDVVTCTYRGHGHALALGVTTIGVIGEICGRVVGCAGGLGGSMHLVGPEVGLLPTFAITGAGLPVSCGAAMAALARGTDRVSVAIFGDGTANNGAFHESLNFAAIRRLPVIFVCENNLYGEYTRINLTTPIEDIALRAQGYAFPGIVVDGQEAGAVADAMAVAFVRARARAWVGEGPTLVEVKTYRYSGHSRSDPATYRPPGELDAWRARDPINLFADRLTAERLLTGDDLAAMTAEVHAEVAAAVAEALAAPEPGNDFVRKRSSPAARSAAWPSPFRLAA